MLKKIAVITVVYQNYEVLNDFLKSFEKQTNKNFHIYIVDLSTEKKQIPINPSTTSIIEGENFGYAHGVNVGLKKALKDNYKKFCVINSDTIVQNNFIESVNKSLQKNPASLIGGKIYYAKGYEYHKSKYNQHDLGKVIWYAGGIIDWKNVYVKHRGVDEVDSNKYNQPDNTEFITGCLMIFDKKVVDKIGLWNKNYFLYYEDADYCERAKRNGIKLYYDPSITIWHKNAQSTGGSGSKLHQKYQEKNRIMFALRYSPIESKLFILKNMLQNRLINWVRS